MVPYTHSHTHTHTHTMEQSVRILNCHVLRDESGLLWNKFTCAPKSMTIDITLSCMILIPGESAEGLNQVDSLLNDSLAAENNDKVLFCQVCELSFTSLNNKRCHYDGRLHRQALLKQLHQAVATHNSREDSSTGSLEQRPCSGDITEQLSHMGKKYKGVSHVFKCMINVNIMHDHVNILKSIQKSLSD